MMVYFGSCHLVNEFVKCNICISYDAAWQHPRSYERAVVCCSGPIAYV